MGAVADADSALRRRVAQHNGSDNHLSPPANWTLHKNGLPQTIAHRGYKASFPENTMGAFKGAVEVGAHAIETDVHLSKDDVVVIAHVSQPQPSIPTYIYREKKKKKEPA